MPRSPSRAGSPAARGLAPLVLLALTLAGCTAAAPDPQPSVVPSTSTSASAPAPTSAAGTATCDYPAAGPAAKPVDPPPTTDVPATGTVKYTVTLEGSPVTLTLDRGRAPCTVNSFASLAEQGYFDSTRCHRLLDTGNFILQCGDPTASGRGGPGYSFADELSGSESYTNGVVAMANAGPDTNGSQFFLVWEDSTGLDQGSREDPGANYTIFGAMDAASRDVVAQLAGEGRDAESRPINPARISTVTRS